VAAVVDPLISAVILITPGDVTTMMKPRSDFSIAPAPIEVVYPTVSEYCPDKTPAPEKVVVTSTLEPAPPMRMGHPKEAIYVPTWRVPVDITVVRTLSARVTELEIENSKTGNDITVGAGRNPPITHPPP
jgi:hypothetical protein